MNVGRDGIVYFCRRPERADWNEHEVAVDVLKRGFWDFFQTKFQEEDVMRRENGKPYYAANPKLKFNMSHCRGGVAVVLSDREVGIDVESMRRVNKRTVRKCCSREEFSYVLGENAAGQTEKDILWDVEERRFLTLWTLKESYVKMTGEGLRIPFDQVCFLPPDLQNGREKDVKEVKGFDSACRHYSYPSGDLMIALTVQWKEGEGEPDFAWKEL